MISSQNESFIHTATKIYQSIFSWIEKFLPAFSLAGFVLGIILGRTSPRFTHILDSFLTKFFNFYAFMAPIAIFVILTPALAKIVNMEKGNGSKFACYSIVWFSLRRLLSLFWAALFATLIFGFPLFQNNSVTFLSSFSKSIDSLGWMIIRSPYFYALYAAIITAVLSIKLKKIKKVLNKSAKLIEEFGRVLIPVIPPFMLTIGAYIYVIPDKLNHKLVGNPGNISPHHLRIAGVSLPVDTSLGAVIVYIAISLLIGLACIIWHLGLLCWTKKKVKEFSISNYFSKYWVRVYPLLWATSSEVIATPLNLYLVKRHFPNIRREVRRFVIGVGSFLNINGTMICVIVLAGAVASILGIKLSFFELLLAIPPVFIIGYGVPGIPGELLLFAGPVAMALSIPQDILPLFLALYLGLQVGLPDSFRTGNNSTDDCVCGILINRIYEKSFLPEVKGDKNDN